MFIYLDDKKKLRKLSLRVRSLVIHGTGGVVDAEKLAVPLRVTWVINKGDR